MSEPWDELLRRLTHGLRIDPDLQRDVSEELHTHLQACMDEHVQAGRSREQAIQLAVRSLGEVDQLADQLYRANRDRIRLRFWLRWAVRVSLTPLLIAAVLIFPLWQFRQHRQSVTLLNAMQVSYEWLFRRICG